MRWVLTKDSKIIVPGSETDNWYLFDGETLEAITPAVNGANLEFTVSNLKEVVALLRTNFDLDTSQLYGKIKSERIRESLKISNNINAHRVTGDNLLTDGSFEEWDDANHLTHWSEEASGSSTVNRESTDVVDGDYAVRLDVNADNSFIQIGQDLTLSAGIYRFSIHCKATGGTGGIAIRNLGNGSYWDWDIQRWTTTVTSKIFNDTAWTQYETILRVENDTTITIKLGRKSAPSQSIYFDNARLEQIGVIEHYDARGGLKVVSDGTSVKKYAIDSQSSNQAELDKVGIG